MLDKNTMSVPTHMHSPQIPDTKSLVSHFKRGKQVAEVSKPFFLRQTQRFTRHFFTIQPGHFT